MSSKNKQHIDIYICGGGSGGHITPAIAIAEALLAIRSDLNLHFIGAKGRMEMDKIPHAGYQITPLWISGLQRGKILVNLLLPFKLMASLLKSWFILLKNKPQVAIGVGGYASGPFLKVAALLGTPILLHEANAFPGITNKLLAKNAAKIFVAYDKMERFFPAEKIIKSGNPIRSSIKNIEGINRTKAAIKFGLDASKPIVFVTGGSLGARSINKALAAQIEQFKAANIQLIWQCGKIYLAEYQSFADAENGIWVGAFIDEMEKAYAAADCIVSRAGALSIAEQQLLGKPIILVPSPNVAEDHQTKNALALLEKNAALMVKDNALEQDLFNTIETLLNDSEKQQTLRQNIQQEAVANAAHVIALEALKFCHE